MAFSELPLRWSLDRCAESLSKQLANQLRNSIGSGELRSNDRLPPTRRWAAALGIARGTVTGAIEQLISEGLLEGRTGAGTYVTAEANRLYQAEPSAAVSVMQPAWELPTPAVDPPVDAAIDLRPCRPCMGRFPLQAWRRCVAAAATMRPSPDYGDAAGHPLLREQIAAYLRRARGLRADPERIIVTNGSVNAMHLLAANYLAPGDAVIFEEPGYPLARQTFGLSGAKVLPCAVDGSGLVVDQLPQDSSRVRLVYVTPSHQFPIGSYLSLARRHALIDWAKKRDVRIVEDDYDGEFRFDVAPLPPLAALAPDTVFYCGTFSKTLFPDLRLGYALASRDIIERLSSYRTFSEYAPNQLNQLALARFIESGQFERHVQRMRREYSVKRQRVAELVKRADAGARLSGLQSGLSVLMEFADPAALERAERIALRHRIAITPLRHYAATPSPLPNALVIGYAAPTLEQLDYAIDLLLESGTAR